MYGAIIGDLAGSIYEFDELKGIKHIKMNNLIEDNAFFSDDSILTIAILDAILNNKDYDFYLRKYINEYKNYKPDFKPYFKSSFSPGLIKWSEGDTQGVSKGNGALMRISPVPFMFDNIYDCIDNATLATKPSHNSKEALSSVTTLALILYYLKDGLDKIDIFEGLDIKPEYKELDHFNTTCKETLNICLYAFYNSNSFEEAISNVLYFGGDTDTNACITGSLAEAAYGIDDDLIRKVNEYLPNEFVKKLEKAYTMKKEVNK